MGGFTFKRVTFPIQMRALYQESTLFFMLGLIDGCKSMRGCSGWGRGRSSIHVCKARFENGPDSTRSSSSPHRFPYESTPPVASASNHEEQRHQNTDSHGSSTSGRRRQLVNTAVRSVLPFDPDASDLPVARNTRVRRGAVAWCWENRTRTL